MVSQWVPGVGMQYGGIATRNTEHAHHNTVVAIDTTAYSAHVVCKVVILADTNWIIVSSCLYKLNKLDSTY